VLYFIGNKSSINYMNYRGKKEQKRYLHVESIGSSA